MKDKFQALKNVIKNVRLSRGTLPENEDLNTIYQKHGSDGIIQIISDIEPLEEVEEIGTINIALPELPEEIRQAPEPPKQEEDNEKIKLEVIHENKILFRANNHYYVLGAISQDLSSLRVTLMIEDQSTARKERTKVDLYERDQVRNLALQLADQFNQNPERIESELLIFTDLLEHYRDKQAEINKPNYQSKRVHPILTPENQKAAIDFLSADNLITRMDKMIEQVGVVGEERTRKLLMVVSATYKMNYPLHALVQGSSGSGKSHLINVIGHCLPPEDVISMTRVTSKSFYHYTKDELVDKLILIQDYDGLDEEAQYAFRELQSAGNVSSSTTYKDRYGNLVSAVKTVRSHFASLLATTKAEVYYDNMSRSVIIGVDETDEQTQRIIEYQNQKLAGLIDEREEQKTKLFLQNCFRCIKPYEVVNRYADKIKLPIAAKMLRRLNNHYQAFVKQITILHQYQRKKDERGRLIAEPQDLKLACDILFDAIMLKVDDLDSSLRQFFDRIKTFIKSEANGKHYEYQFTQRDVRLALNISKTQCFRYMEDLESLEYLQKTGGYANRGFKYKIVFWDDMDKIRSKIKEELNHQLEQLPGGS